MRGLKKKLSALLMVSVLVFGLVGCGSKGDQSD